MRNRWILMVVLLIRIIPLAGQSFSLHGSVTDEEGHAIAFATVSCVAQGKATMTSLKGEYQLGLHSSDSVVIRFSMIGYRTKTRVLRRPKGMQTLRVTLHSDATSLGEVSVTGQKIQSGQTQEITTEHLTQLPSVTGNAVEELIQSQAGVSTHSELSSQYNVRGGAFDENAVYINDVEVYRPFLVRSGQQEGLSIINPDMVDKIEFSTGGFEAKYGDRMSSALGITYRKPKRTEASISASLLGGSAYLGLKARHLTWQNAIRYKTTKYLLGTFDTQGEYQPNYLDYQTCLTYQPNKRWSVEVIGDVSDNHYDFTPTDRDTKFGTMDNVKSFRVYFDGQERDRFLTCFGALNITRHFGDSTSVSLLASAFNTDERECYDIQGQYWLTQTETSENLGVGTYFLHARNYLKGHVESVKLMARHVTRHHRVEGGVAYRMEHIEENSREYEQRDSAGYNIPSATPDLQMVYALRSRNTLDARRLEVYLQDTWRFRSRGGHTLFTLHYGLRFARWSYTGESILSPRVALDILPPFNPNITFRVATGLYYQAPFFKELRDTSTVNGMTTVTLNKHIRSQQSIHFIAGMDYRFDVAGRPFKFTAEAYYKALSHLIPYTVNNVKVTYYGDNVASGHVAGLDLKLYGEFVPGTDSWLSFSLMDARMRLNGMSLPLPTDQRYAVNLYFTDYFPGTKRWKMNLKLSLADGLPFNVPHKELSTRYFRAPAYKRADIGMSYLLYDREDRGRTTSLRTVWLGVDCLNLFGISNVNSYYWITDVSNQQYAVPNYLTGRQINLRVRLSF